MKHFIFLFFLLSSVLSLGALPPENVVPVSPSEIQRIASSKAWLYLIHYEGSWFGGLKSQAQGDQFFLAKEGKSDPAAELRATIEAFQSDRVVDDEYAQCRFPARLIFLRKELGPRGVRFPERFCLPYATYLQNTSAKSISLIFSSYYLNNPASAFGHVFLRLNKSDEPNNGERSELMDNGLSFSAEVTQSNPLLYAFYGMAGFFRGNFSYVPYFYKIREYNDAESRDIWEYRIRMTDEEREMLLAHIWELGSTYYTYYYFTQNCAYHMISTLQAAMPELPLLEAMPSINIPVDTVKVLARFPGLVEEVRYRPSIRTSWETRVETLTQKEKGKILELASNERTDLSSLSTEEKVKVFDGAIEFVDLRHFKDLVDYPTGEIAHQKQNLLASRSEIPVASHALQVRRPESAPHEGHDSFRLGIGGGTGTQDGRYFSTSIRFALHDLVDPLVGYPKYAQIEFFGANLRYAAQRENLIAEEVTVFRVVSLAPITQFHIPLSWRVFLGGARVRDQSCDHCVAGLIEVGGGFTVNVLDSLSAFAMVDSSVAGAPGFYQSFFRPGIGPSLGVRWILRENLVSLLTLNYRRLFFSPVREIAFGSAEVKWGLTTQFSIGAKASHYPDGWDTGLSTYFYF